MAHGMMYHKGDTEMELLKIGDDEKMPEIVFSPQAQETIGYILCLTDDDNEIGFLGTVDYDKERQAYIVGEIFIPHQEVSMAECTLMEKGVSELARTLIKEKGVEYASKLLFWGHVHPNGTEPSSQDEDQMEQFTHNDWFIRAIFDRSGDSKVDFFDYKSKVKYLDCSWRGHIWEVTKADAIKKAIEKRVKIAKEKDVRVRTKRKDGTEVVASYGNGYGYGSRYQPWDSEAVEINNIGFNIHRGRGGR